jgi:hypothetical protein
VDAWVPAFARMTTKNVLFFRSPCLRQDDN